MNSTTIIDESTLNFAERYWAEWFKYFESEFVATTIISFLMHEVVYFGRCVPFWVIDYIPYFHKYKLQPVSFILYIYDLIKDLYTYCYYYYYHLSLL